MIHLTSRRVYYFSRLNSEQSNTVYYSFGNLCVASISISLTTHYHLTQANGYLLGKVRVALKYLGSHVTRKERRETRRIEAAGEINEAVKLHGFLISKRRSSAITISVSAFGCPAAAVSGDKDKNNPFSENRGFFRTSRRHLRSVDSSNSTVDDHS